MKPLKNYALVVELGEDTKKTAGGIILTNEIETGSKPALVLATGNDCSHVQKMDKVALDWGKGMPVTIEGEKALLISEDFIYGVY